MAGIQSVSLSAAQSLASVSPQNGQSLQPFANLDLTESQRTQLRSIFQNAKQNGTSPSQVQQQVNAVLTPQQQQTLQSDQAAFGGHHHHHHDASSGDSGSTDGTSDAISASSTATASSSSTAATSSGSSAATTANQPSLNVSQTLLSFLQNVQNQAAAAASTNTNTLQAQLIATGNVPSQLNQQTS